MKSTEKTQVTSLLVEEGQKIHKKEEEAQLCGNIRHYCDECSKGGDDCGYVLPTLGSTNKTNIFIIVLISHSRQGQKQLNSRVVPG